MKTLIVTSLLALSASTAMAADAVYETPAPPVAQETLPVFTWSGPYLGIQGGAGWANGDFSAGGPVASDNFDGGILGAFAGYNYQFDNNFVVGIEGDVDYNWNDNDYAGVQIGTDWQGSVRGRVGYAFDRALLYGQPAGQPHAVSSKPPAPARTAPHSTATQLARVLITPSPTMCSAGWNIATMIMATRTFSASIPISISTPSRWASV